MDFVFCMHIWKCVKSPTYDLSLLVTQRGLSLTEDMAVSSPTVPEPPHGKVGVKEGDIQRHIENEMETEEEEEGEAQWERREGGYDSQRRCLPFLCVTPKPWNEPIHDDCFSLYLISITGSAIPVHTVKWHLKIPVIEYGNGRGGGCKQWTTILLCRISSHRTSPQSSHHSLLTPDIFLMTWITIPTETTLR